MCVIERNGIIAKILGHSPPKFIEISFSEVCFPPYCYASSIFELQSNEKEYLDLLSQPPFSFSNPFTLRISPVRNP